MSNESNSSFVCQAMNGPSQSMPPSSIATASSRLRTLFIYCAAGGWLTCLVGVVLIPLIDVESIMFTGPIILAMGLAMLALTTRLRYTLGRIWAGALIALTVGVFLMIVLLSLSPSEAYWPVFMIGSAFTFISAPLAYLTCRSCPSGFQPWQCRACGYPLIGLASTACPECGCAFDPDKVSVLLR